MGIHGSADLPKPPRKMEVGRAGVVKDGLLSMSEIVHELTEVVKENDKLKEEVGKLKAENRVWKERVREAKETIAAYEQYRENVKEALEKNGISRRGG